MGVRISKRIENRIVAAGSRRELFISAISSWEVAMGAQRGKIRIAGGVVEWIHDALDALSASVAATARRLGAVLVTADSRILAYASSTKAVRVLEI